MALISLKKEVTESSLNEGVIENMLYSCVQMRSGKHHLYDDILLTGGSGDGPLAGGGRSTADKTMRTTTAEGAAEEFNFDEQFN